MATVKMAGILFFPEFPQGSPAQTGGLQSFMAVTSMFTVRAENMPFGVFNIYFHLFICPVRTLSCSMQDHSSFTKDGT